MEGVAAAGHPSLASLTVVLETNPQPPQDHLRGWVAGDGKFIFIMFRMISEFATLLTVVTFIIYHQQSGYDGKLSSTNFREIGDSEDDLFQPGFSGFLEYLSF